MIVQRYVYLSDREFLEQLDDMVNQRYRYHIYLLDFNERPVREIQGEITSGSLSKDGSSSVRTTCQLSIVITPDTSVDDFGVNRKVYLEVGVDNRTSRYEQYPVLWFPQGIFYISDASISSTTTSPVTMSLTLKDKMCGLNGDIGGSFPAPVILDQVDTQDPITGKKVTKKVRIYDIIQELVHHYGGEPITNILIEDVPIRIRQIVRWTGDNPLYLEPRKGGGNTFPYYIAHVKKPTGVPLLEEYLHDDDVGYIYQDFVYTDDLSFNLGESVVSALDKIRDYLGNFEYFYDEFGVFHFREIRNFLNTSQASVLTNDYVNVYLNKVTLDDYKIDTSSKKTVYKFDVRKNLISITRTPQYGNVKNDYIILGTQKGTNKDIKRYVRYRLCIDEKPPKVSGDNYNTYNDLLLYKEPKTEVVRPAFPLHIDKFEDLPKVGNFNVIYGVGASPFTKFYYWEDTVYKECNVVKYYETGYTVTDWRTEIYLQGLLAKNNGSDATRMYSNLSQTFDGSDSTWIGDILRYQVNRKLDPDHYFEELDAFWPQVYDLQNQRFYRQQGTDVTSQRMANEIYYLDFIDSMEMRQFSVSNIGRRTDGISDDNINCLFTPKIPNVIFVNVDGDREQMLKDRQTAQEKWMPYTQVRGNVYNALGVGGYKNSAFEKVKYELYLHTNYQNALSISSIPALYLQPNSRVEVYDPSTKVSGDYMIRSISIPLAPGNAMTCSLNECFERF